MTTPTEIRPMVAKINAHAEKISDHGLSLILAMMASLEITEPQGKSAKIVSMALWQLRHNRTTRRGTP